MTENEFWIDLTWRIDPDGDLGIRWFAESKARPGEKLTVDEYYGHIFDNSVPGLPEAAKAEDLTPLQYMRRYGAFELSDHVGPLYEEEVAGDQLVDIGEDLFGRVYTAAPAPAPDNLVPTGVPDPDEEGRRPAGVRVDGVVRRGFPTPSGRLEFYSSTLAQWAWPQFALPTYIRSHVHPDNLADGQVPLISTFRLPVQIHTRSANAKWLDEIPAAMPLALSNTLFQVSPSPRAAVVHRSPPSKYHGLRNSSHALSRSSLSPIRSIPEAKLAPRSLLR